MCNVEEIEEGDSFQKGIEVKVSKGQLGHSGQSSAVWTRRFNSQRKRSWEAPRGPMSGC